MASSNGSMSVEVKDPLHTLQETVQLRGELALARADLARAQDDLQLWRDALDGANKVIDNLRDKLIEAHRDYEHATERRQALEAAVGRLRQLHHELDAAASDLLDAGTKSGVVDVTLVPVLEPIQLAAWTQRTVAAYLREFGPHTR